MKKYRNGQKIRGLYDQAAVFQYFCDEIKPPMETLLDFFDEEFFWMQLRLRVLDFYTKKNPCRRPSAWWRYETELLGGRQMVSGQARLLSEVFPSLTDYEYFSKGLPCDLIVDADDLPVYETENGFLRRHNLLSKLELKMSFPETEIFTGRMFAFDSASGKYIAVNDDCKEAAQDMLKRINDGF